MKLNQYQKQAIVRAIFDDVPVADNETIKAAVQAAIVKAMSPECRKAYRACPKALETRSTHDVTTNIVSFITGDMSSDTFSEVIAPWVAAKAKYRAAKSALGQAIESCQTLKHLNDRLPEFAAYFPNPDAPTQNLPIIANAVQMLTALGWKPKKTGK